MRMWMVNPRIMCRQHLLGEHVELHMFASCLKEGKSIKGYLENGCLEPASICTRHDELVKEMKEREYSHKTPLELDMAFTLELWIDRGKSLKLLLDRCPKCRERYNTI